MANKSKAEAEQWLPVVGYEGFYEVSDYGNVRSVDRTYIGRNHNCDRFEVRINGRVIKPSQKRNGYLQVNLYRNGRMRSRAVHRLVMEAFRGMSELTVNHVNEDKTDNRLCNLEYMTTSENVRYSSARPVESYDLSTGETVKRYQSEIDVRDDGFDVGAVNNCVLKKPRYLSHHGFGWRFSSV